MFNTTYNYVFVKSNLFLILGNIWFKKKQHMGYKRFIAVCDISCCWYGTGLENSEEGLEVLRLAGVREPIEMI